MANANTSNTAPIPILTYHQIAPTPAKGTPFRSLCVAPADFSRHMHLLKRLGYQGLSMRALMPYLRGEKTGKVIGITFDDGYHNNLEHALPVLQKLGFSSTCYVVSQRVGQTNIWDLEVGIPQVPLMNADELRQWVAGGQEVGAHTRHHVHLPQLDALAAEDEIAGCKEDLEAIVGEPVNHFCYPYGDYDTTNLAMVQRCGFETATTTHRGRTYAEANLLELRRVSVVRRTSRVGLLIKILSRYEDRD